MLPFVRVSHVFKITIVFSSFSLRGVSTSSQFTLPCSNFGLSFENAFWNSETAEFHIPFQCLSDSGSNAPECSAGEYFEKTETVSLRKRRF